ncbi:hypothetical protein FB45DRAFT_1031503 [Roridomyces roridus]|uniref:Uncharacterized protein n=1 Tax=Roridomyces roridus TaxID=1738132 RepID=A0AAD7BKK0_9AGAR|nr:hypothetical protein FB45DRAFT_1031503 [Roridomyces roridus]
MKLDIQLETPNIVVARRIEIPPRETVALVGDMMWTTTKGIRARGSAALAPAANVVLRVATRVANEGVQIRQWCVYCSLIHNVFLTLEDVVILLVIFQERDSRKSKKRSKDRESDDEDEEDRKRRKRRKEKERSKSKDAKEERRSILTGKKASQIKLKVDKDDREANREELLKFLNSM